MSHAMIWTFGILAFLLLLILFATWPGKHGGTDHRLAQKVIDGQQETQRQLAEMTTQLDALRTQLSAMERILKEVE